MKEIKALIIIAALLLTGGCSNFFEKQSTEVETRKTLNEIGQVKENPNVKNPLPELYRQPPQRLNVNGKVKLFYFTKHHTVDKLTNLVTSQMGVKVDQNPATNQLIIECNDDKQADGVLEYLERIDVPPIQVNIDCMVLERFADITMDWQTKIRVENILGEGIWASGKGDDLAFPGAALRESKREQFGLDLGVLRGKEGHKIKAVIDMLVSRGYLKVLMNPTIETINGQTAKVTSMEEAKHDKIVSGKSSIEPYTVTEYVPVTDSLQVTPNVYADGSIGLKTKVTLGSASKPEGVAQASVITERSVDMTENRIAPGDSLVIGGIRKSERRSVIRGVPFFKDLPLIGIFFSSKDFEENATETIFILTPTISSGGKDYAEMAEEVRKKHAIPEYDTGIEQALTDPFGLSRYSAEVKEKAAEAEFERFKAELEKAEAQQDLSEAKQALLKKAEEIMQEKQKALQTARQAQQAKEEAQQMKKEAEELKKSYQQAKQQLEETQKSAQEKSTRLKELEKALEQARRQEEQAEQKYQQNDQQEEQAQQHLQELRKETEKLEAELERAKQESPQDAPDEPEADTESDKTSEKSDEQEKTENKNNG